eukprot:m.84207 g.84207  ORF g.84207 m.84207 type:complete len:619 (+) comp8710_c0_seq4:2571-4427(+)
MDRKRRAQNAPVYIMFSLRKPTKNCSITLSQIQVTQFLPEGLFPRVLARLVASSQYLEGQAPQICKTKALFYFTEFLIELELVPDVGGIRVIVHSPKPRPLLRMVKDCVTEVLRDCYPDLKCNTLLPYNENCLVFMDDVIANHAHKRAIWVANAKVKVKVLETLYCCWLPSTGLLGYYDAFISYRQTANSNFAVNLNLALETQQLTNFLDSNNLETGKNFKMSFMDAISKSLVACPLVSESAISRMYTIADSDYCDNVLLEWWCMQALVKEIERDNNQSPEYKRVLLRRVIPLFLSNSWTNRQVTASEEINDSFKGLSDMCSRLPDMVSIETYKPLCDFFDSIKLPKPEQLTVREIVKGLLDVDAVMCFLGNALGRTETSHSGHPMASKPSSTPKWSKVPEYANEIRQVVANVKLSLKPDNNDAYLRRIITLSADHSSSSSSGNDVSEEDEEDGSDVGNEFGKLDGGVLWEDSDKNGVGTLVRCASTSALPTSGHHDEGPNDDKTLSTTSTTISPPLLRNVTVAGEFSQPVLSWSVAVVCSWLEREQFSFAVVQRFQEELVDGGVLSELTADVMHSDLGMSKLQSLRLQQHRNVLLERDGIKIQRRNNNSDKCQCLII